MVYRCVFGNHWSLAQIDLFHSPSMNPSLINSIWSLISCKTKYRPNASASSSRWPTPPEGRPVTGPRWTVPVNEIRFRFMASGGPGGQHANRANTKVEAVFRLDESATMPEALRERVRDRIGPVVRVTVDDEPSLMVDARASETRRAAGASRSALGVPRRTRWSRRPWTCRPPASRRAVSSGRSA